MRRFPDWFNQEDGTDLVIKAAVALVWFLSIHPFDDGNGRIGRALTDMLLARSDNSTQRFYSMSAQIRIKRKQYADFWRKHDKTIINERQR
ncbi:MAG: Fic family protein [Bacteroidales bacterium]